MWKVKIETSSSSAVTRSETFSPTQCSDVEVWRTKFYMEGEIFFITHI